MNTLFKNKKIPEPRRNF